MIRSFIPRKEFRKRKWEMGTKDKDQRRFLDCKRKKRKKSEREMKGENK